MLRFLLFLLTTLLFEHSRGAYAQENGPAGILLADRPDLLATKFERVFVIDVDRQIDGLFYWYVNNRLEQAKDWKADAVVLRLTTPGGDLEASLDIARTLRDLDWAKTIVWIPKEAISGGAIVSLGADAIYMHSSSILGDAGPIMIGPGGMFVHAEEKIVSYTASAVGELAESSQRPAVVAKAMVDRKLKVIRAIEKATNRTTYVTEQQANDPKVLEQFEIGEAIEEAGNDRFLTAGAQRAKELQLCDEIFESEADLLARLTDGPIKSTSMGFKDRLVYTLNNPWLTGLLLVIGLIGLYFELAMPGTGIGGLLALLCFGVFFWSHFLGGTAGWLEFLFFVLGVACLMIELFVLPGFGIFGIAGFGLTAAALIMATQDFLVPETPEQWASLQTNAVTVLGAFIALGLLFTAQLMIFDTIPGLSRFQLRPEVIQQAPSDGLQHASGALVSKGDRGISQSDLRPSGKAMFGEHLIDVLTEGDYVERGTDVVVIKIEGNFVTVRRVS